MIDLTSEVDPMDLEENDVMESDEETASSSSSSSEEDPAPVLVSNSVTPKCQS